MIRIVFPPRDSRSPAGRPPRLRRAAHGTGILVGLALILVPGALVGCGGARGTGTDSRLLSKIEESQEQLLKLQEQIQQNHAETREMLGRPQGLPVAGGEGFSPEMAEQIRAIYGNTEEIALAVGETRVVATGSGSCLRARPTPGTDYEPVFCMKQGTPIFRCRDSEVDGWMRGLYFTNGKVYEIYFSEKFTKRYVDVPMSVPVVKEEG